MAPDISSAIETLKNLNLQEAIIVIKPLALYIVGLLIYSIFIFNFYRFVAKKDIFNLNLGKYNTSEVSWMKKLGSFFLYVLEYLIIFPLFTIFWFVILFLLMVFLAKNQTIEIMLLASVAIVAIIRATAYYNEDLSKDLAKILPFTLLGIFIIDNSYFSLSSSLDLIRNVPLHISSIAYYLIVIIGLEFVLRIGHGIYSMFKPEEEEEVKKKGKREE